MFGGTAHVVLGSGLTIAGAMYCLSLTRMPYFQSMGVPCAVGIVAGVAVALTLGPAIVTVGSRFGLLEPKRAMRIRAWRRVGTMVVRWPGPILVASMALALIGLAALPGYQTSYDDTRYIPESSLANAGLSAATEHFSLSRMSPEVMLVESDRDLRNSSDFLILDRLAKRVFGVEGVARVQAPTRPDGAPIAHTSIPFLISMQGVGQQQNMKLMQDRIADMRAQADDIGETIDTMKTMYRLMSKFSNVTTNMITDMKAMRETVHQIRDMVADFDDQFRPTRSYFYREPHCYNIPLCWSFRSLFDSMDGIGTMTDTFDKAVVNMDEILALLPEMLATFGPMIETMESMQQMMLTTYATMDGFYGQMDELTRDSTELGKAFDAAKNDDSFYLPPEVFENEDFKQAMESFFSPDGKTVLHAGRPPWQPDRPGRTRARRAHQDRGHRSPQGHPARRRRDLPRGYRGDLQGHGRRIALRPYDRADLGDVPGLSDHAVADPQPGGRAGDRRYRHVVAGRLLRAVDPDLAAHRRDRAALDGARAVDHRADRGRIGLQPAAGVAVQGGARCRDQDRDHPLDRGGPAAS